MSRKTLGLTAGLVVAVGLISVAVAQTRRPVVNPHDQLIEALNQGRYDQLASLAAGMNAQDPAVVALVARAAIERGNYQEAETMLTPVAQRAPASDAALELALLFDMLG